MESGHSFRFTLLCRANNASSKGMEWLQDACKEAQGDQGQ